MARKRGGLAGIWDRNKKIIKPIATGLAGVLGTPALGAAVGAAMGGLDREGKGGIGFDLKRGAMGGIQGYGMGKIGSALGGAAGIGKVGALERMGSTLGGSASGLKGGVMNRLGMGGVPSMPSVNVPTVDMVNTAGGLAPSAATGGVIGGMASPAASGGFRAGLGNVLRDGKTIKAIGDTALGGFNAVQQNRQMQMERDQLNRRNRIEDEEIARRQAMDPVRAQLLAALFQRMGLNTGAV